LKKFLNEIKDIYKGNATIDRDQKSSPFQENFEVYVKENLGDITQVKLNETKKNGQTIYSFEKKSFYSSNDEVLFVFTGDSNMVKSFNSAGNKGNTYIFKKNGAIIETEKNNTLNILNYYMI